MRLRVKSLTNKTYNIENSPFYGLNSRKKLIDLLYISDYKQLEYLAEDIGNYKVFDIKNKNKDTKRTIEEPKIFLKKVQKQFNNLLQRVETPDFVKAGKKGSCYVNNGQAHINGKYFYCTDIKKFFPNAKKEKVFQFLLYELKISNDIAYLLANILCYENHLPTGSPSSQLLTYWSYKKTFNDIYEKALSLNITMTLFVDDLTFSSSTTIPESFKEYVKSRIESVNLSINVKKSKTYSKNRYKKVTGTVVTPANKLAVPNKLQHKIFTLKYKDSKTEKEIQSLKGMLNSARQIEPMYMDNYYKELLCQN